MTSLNQKEDSSWQPIPTEAIVIENFNDASRELFFQQLCQKVTLLTKELNLQMMSLQMSESGDIGIASIQYTPQDHPTGLGLIVLDSEIFIHQEAFTIDGVDNTDLIPITIEHEMTEVWVDLMNYYNDPSKKNYRLANGVAHKSGVMAEFALAHKLGLADRYLDLVIRWAQDMSWEQAQVFLEENFYAYQATSYLANNSHSSIDD